MSQKEPEAPSYVVVFPSVFAKKRIPRLISDIKAALKMRGQQFKSVARDGDIIRIHASDPVFASSAVGLVFGISRVAIARRAGTGLEELASRIASVGGNLLLSGERFLVRVEGATRGFTAKDAEMAATSRIIEKRELQAVPGTEGGFDKELYAYVTRSSSYICIFSDGASWGVPREGMGSGSGGRDVATHCAVYDELSALACFECMRQGYNVSITAFYKKRSDLLGVARLLNRLIPRTLRSEVELEFVRMGTGRAGRSYLAHIGAVTDVMINRADKKSRISLAVMPGAFPSGAVDLLATSVFERGMIPLVPLAGVGAGMYEIAREMSLGEAGIKRLEGRVAMAPTESIERMANEICPPREDGAVPERPDVQKISVRVGANNVHDILDALYPPSPSPSPPQPASQSS